MLLLVLYRLTSQAPALLKAFAFVASEDADTSPIVPVTIIPSLDGSYIAAYTPTSAAKHTVVVVMSTALEVQQFTTLYTAANAAGGSFSVTVAGHKTVPLAWDASADDIAEAISALPTGAATVTRTAAAAGAGYVYTVTFTEHVGDVPQLTVNSNLIGLASAPTVTTVTQGAAKHIKTTDAPLVNEVQTLTIGGGATGTFILHYRGEFTAPLTVGSGTLALDIETALQGLGIIGDVSVVETSAGSNVFTITFLPEPASPAAGSTMAHWLTYGDLPLITVTGAATPITVVETKAGVSPFSATVAPAELSAAHTTAVDQVGVADAAGLHTGQYGFPTSFTIQSRDKFGNRITTGPQKEVQIISVGMAAGNTAPLAGSFSVSYGSNSVSVPADTGILGVEALLEAISGVGAVTVTTDGVTTPTVSATTAAVQNDAYTVAVSAALAGEFVVGDWIRLCSTTGPVFTVEAVATAPSGLITLNMPFPNDSAAACAVYTDSNKSYRYIVTFDSALGDLPALTVDGSKLRDSAATPTAVGTTAAVSACDWNAVQTVTTTAPAAGNGALGGYFQLRYGKQITAQLRYDATAPQVQGALEALQGIATAATTVSAPVALARTWTVTVTAAGGAELLPIVAEGYLLTGSGSAVVAAAICPAGTAAGMTGAAWLVSLTDSAGERSVVGSASYTGSGLFTGVYTAPRTAVAPYELHIAEALSPGLLGQYWNNRWMYDDPVMERIDPRIDFVWDAATNITATGLDYISVLWSGWVQPTFSEDFKFTAKVNDGASLWIDDQLLFDNFQNDMGNADTGKFSTFSGVAVGLQADRLYNITMKYRENYGAAMARLSWESASQRSEVVPSHRLFYKAESIKASPFDVVPTARKPAAPAALTLEVTGWDELLADYEPPTDDGGAAVTAYKVEWWLTGDYGTKEQHTITLSANADGGTWQVRSPVTGALYPRTLPYNAAPAAVKAALEATAGVQQVTVTYNAGVYTVVFDAVDGALSAAVFAVNSGLTATAGGATSATTARTVLAVPGASVAAPAVVAATQKRITNLVPPSLPSAGFSVRVSARNSLGEWGPPSTTVSAIPMAAPATPATAELLIVPGSATALQVYWTAPASVYSSAVTAYTVEWSTSKDFGASAAAAAAADAAADTAAVVAAAPAVLSHTGTFPQTTRPGVFEYTITGLTPGAPVYVRVTATNGAGTGSAKATAPAAVTPMTAPDQLAAGGGVTMALMPASEAVSVKDSIQSLATQFAAPRSTGGAPVLDYLVEWWMAADSQRSEVQVISTGGPAGAYTGAFRLVYEGETTVYLHAAASEAEVEAALEALPSLRDVTVVRTAAPAPAAAGNEWSVTFNSEVPASALTVVSSTIMSGAVPVTPTVGAALAATKPGTKGSVSATITAIDISNAATTGSTTVAVTGGSAALVAGLWIALPDDMYLIESVNGAFTSITLAEAYTGAPVAAVTAAFGTTVTGRAPVSYKTAVVEGAAAAGLTLAALNVGEKYTVRVSARNAAGLALPRVASPAFLAPPRQAPAPPQSAQVFPAGATQLRVLWNAPESDGGSTVTK
jgi:PA14 domain/Fibronectin type III domain